MQPGVKLKKLFIFILFIFDAKQQKFNNNWRYIETKVFINDLNSISEKI
jgi:hypothetical protein